ncbi:MAG: choice-of-anchor D domain-containing protein [Sedimentisphaerales bacterium]|nr:choice-of-anchor D domain-containing protein [Sedimentisphaerales bacterium]
MKRPLLKSITNLLLMLSLCSVVAVTAEAADDNLNIIFTTTDAGGQYGNRHIHVVWLANTSGTFVSTAGTNVSNNRAVWAYTRKDSFQTWWTSARQEDIDARTGATQTSYKTYNIDWNFRKLDNSVIPDGTYRLYFECTNSDSGSPRNFTYFTITKGRSAWTMGPTTQGGYNSVTLTYTPAVSPEIELLPTSIDFGLCNVGMNTEQGFAILNRTATPLQITTLAISGSDAGAYSLVSAPVLPFDVPPGTRVPGRVDITVRFSPDSVRIFNNAQVDVGAGGLPPVSKVTVTGEGIPPELPEPHIEISPGELAFGDVPVGGQSELSFDIRSTGKGTLGIRSLEVVGLDKAAYSFVSPPAVPFELPPETGVQTIIVRFLPGSGREYGYSAVAVGSKDPNKPVSVVSLGGQGIASPVASLLVVGSIGGDTRAIALSNQYALLGQGATLTILNVSDPCNPTAVGLARLADVIQAVTTVGNTAYAAGGASGLLPVDITDVSTPAALAVADTPGYAYDVAASGTTLCVADGPEGLAFYDISTPTAPALRGTYETQGSATAVALSGTTAYVLDDQLGLQIVDVAGTAGILVGSCNRIEFGRSITLAGTLACITDSLGNLFVVDAVDPAAPVLRGQLRLLGTGMSIEVARIDINDVAYVAAGDQGIEVILLSEPDSPVHLGAYDTSGQASDLTVFGSSICVADGDAGMEVLNIAGSAADISPVAAYRFQSSPYAAGTGSPLAFLAAGEFGLLTVDLSVPASPEFVSVVDNMLEADMDKDNAVDLFDFSLLGRYWGSNGTLGGDIHKDNVVNALDLAKLAADWLTANSLNEVQDIVVTGTIASLANGRSGFQIVDISDPFAPQAIGDYRTYGPACSIAVDGSVAMVADGTSVYVLNVSNPSAPSLVGRWESGGWAKGVAIDGAFGYVANGGRGLQILNLADASPAASYDTPGTAYSVAVANNIAFVADGQAGVQILNVATPSSPSPISSFDTGSLAVDVAVSGSLLFVAGQTSITVVDVSSPVHPLLYARSNAAVRSLSTAVAGAQIIVSDSKGGLAILRLE